MSKIKIGDEFKTKNFGMLKVISYENCKKVGVKFKDTGYETVAWANRIREGGVKDNTLPIIYGVGFLGDGLFKSIKNSKHEESYTTWNDMLRRCYSEKEKLRSPTYSECTVCDSWHNFQTFALWYKENHIKGCQIDKDIKIKGNKVYSPSTCLFVTKSLNTLFTDRRAKRGLLPIGVTYKGGKFEAQCSSNGGRRYIGVFDTKEDAFNAYKKQKNIQVQKAMEQNPEIAIYLRNHLN